MDDDHVITVNCRFVLFSKADSFVLFDISPLFYEKKKEVANTVISV